LNNEENPEYAFGWVGLESAVTGWKVKASQGSCSILEGSVFRHFWAYGAGPTRATRTSLYSSLRLQHKYRYKWKRGL